MRLSWKIYAVVYALLILLNLYFNLYHDQRILGYYEVLTALDSRHWIKLVSFYLACLMDFLGLIPLLLFAFKVRSPWQDIWKLIFIGRILGVLLGRSYEYNYLASMLQVNAVNTCLSLTISILVAFPSFAAQFVYAFRRK